MHIYSVENQCENMLIWPGACPLVYKQGKEEVTLCSNITRSFNEEEKDEFQTLDVGLYGASYRNDGPGRWPRLSAGKFGNRIYIYI